ncbi:PA14 domain-containing protein [Paenibacillus pasadenensis]|uniref:PA14 domain-containing protein n=1 Tax=Paenibacillus pasadenensis TaxID=217090 RepID=UPI00203D194C|nr:PA14 domain-containing protein [Paenibacillus pasadenensis]MCM3748342.1 PA14 domain-containing protein [Paenibacillus pasadenensis]
MVNHKSVYLTLILLVGLFSILTYKPQISSANSAPGLKAEYYDNKNLTNLKLSKVESSINFHWGLNSPNTTIEPETFSARFTGKIEPKYSESYTFYIVADDGVRLWVNNQLILDRWNVQAGEFTSTSISLEKSTKYDIKLEYFENKEGAAAELRWSSASQNKETVPASQFSQPVESVGSGLKGEYYNSKDFKQLEMVRTDPQVHFLWGLNSPDSKINADRFSVRWSGKIKPRYSENYSFSLLADDGVRLWVNDALILDSWKPQATSLTSSSISLKAGYSYNIVLEYYENKEGSTIVMEWASPSQASEIIPASQLYPAMDGSGVGLKGEYFDNIDLSNLKFTKIDSMVNFAWQNASPSSDILPDTYSIRWTGAISPRYSEEYTFMLDSDDGVRLWVDGQLIIDSWQTIATERTSKPIKLVKDRQYKIKIEYYENLGDSSVKLAWKSASQTVENVPKSRLFPPTEKAGVGLQGQYYNNIHLEKMVVAKVDPVVNFSWSSGSVHNMSQDYSSVRWSGTITPRHDGDYIFYLDADDGVRLWVNGKLLIDDWRIFAGERTSAAIQLITGNKYDIVIEYFENTGGAASKLSWSSQLVPKEVVPQSQLDLPVKILGKIEYHYDAAGRLIRIQYPTGEQIIFDYDENGNLLKKYDA